MAQVLSACPVLWASTAGDQGLWTGCLLIQHGCSYNDSTALLQEVNCLTILPGQRYAIAFKEVNNASGFKKMGVMKDQFYTLGNPKE